MAAMEPLCHLIGVSPKKFSKEEFKLLEAEIFIRICDELKEVFRQQYKDFFYLMKFTIIQEDTMLEKNFTQFILNDILSTKEYTIQGIAYYADIPEDVIQELASGLNTRPLATYLRRVIELHRLVRRELYQAIGKKIIASYLAAA
jgi:hypothetical protein